MQEDTTEEGAESRLMKNRKDGKANILPQVRIAIVASLGLLISGNTGGWPGSVLTKMGTDFEMMATENSLVVSLASYGSLVGSIFSGKGMDIFGRRKLMFAAAPVTVCGWALIGIATNIYVVYIGRFVCGLSSGILFASSSIYTSETCQASLRGRLGSLPALSLTFGVLISYVLGAFFSWHVSAFLCIIPALLLFAGLFTVPESPYWYLLKGNDKAASESLTRLRGPNFNIEHEIKEITQKICDVGTNISYLELLKRRTLLPFAVALFIHSVQQLCGANIIMVYTSNIFEMAQSSIDAQMATIYTGGAQVVGTLISLLLIDKYGRRILLTISVTFCGIFLAVFGGYFITLSNENPWPAWTPLVILLGYVFSFCLGCRTVPWLMGSELFNTSVRSRANSGAIFYNRILNVIVLQVYPYTINAFGESVVFLFYGILCFVFAGGTLLFVPETKGKSLEEIQEYFEKRALKKNEKDLNETATN